MGTVFAKLTAAALAIVLAAGTQPPQANAAAGTQPPQANAAACPAQQLGPAAAEATARRCGQRVEVAAWRSETAQTFVNADGTATVEQSIEPRWARRADGSWGAPDTSLRKRPDGTFVPVAAVQPMAFSGGGSAPMARLTAGTAELAVSWPTALPAPVIVGDTAVYPEVLPGVDLRLTASALGFAHVLVVRTRAATALPALRRLSFGLSAKGLAVAVNAGGGLEARDAAGNLVFAAPAPLMWDSGEPADAGGRLQAVMAVKVAGSTLTVTPDPALLDNPAARLPLYIDPSWSGRIADNAWTSFWSKFPTSSFWQNGTALNNAATYGGAGHGRTEDCTGCADHIIRSVFRMDVSGVRGKQIQRGIFRIQQRHAWTCNPASNAQLWLTDTISPSNTWSSQPFWNSDWRFQRPGNHKVGAIHSCADVGDLEFDVTSLIRSAAASGWMTVNLGLRAIDEGSLLQWKRFNASSPVLAIDYNTIPNMPDSLTVDGKACVAGSGRPFVSTATPVLRARVSDADGQSQQLHFAYAAWDAGQGRFVDAGGGVRESVPNGGFGQITTAALADGGIYTFRVQSNDYNGGVSPVTHVPGNCEWQVDLSDPAVPAVTSDLYREGSAGCPPAGCGGVGQTGIFTFASSADVTSYRWGFSDPPSTVVAAPAPGAAVSVAWTPTTGGARTLFVQAIDRSGRTSRRTYQFTVAGPSPAVGWWRLDEPAGTASLADSSGGGHAAALTGGVLGVPGRIPGGETALSMSGAANFAATAGPVFDTGRSFTVSAWVKLADRTGPLVMVDQTGTGAAAFKLEYSVFADAWALSFSVADVNPPTWVAALSTSRPVLNSWTHVTGVYDSAARQGRLYVNGRLEGNVGGVTTWNATGPLHIGRSAFQATGAVSDIRVWNRMLLDSEVAAMSDPLLMGKVGEWRMEEVGPGPAFDSSGMGHDLTFHDGASIPPGGSGQTGTGLRLGNPSGYATTGEPVVYTDQSFTVSAWVRLTQVPAVNRTAVAQSGQWVSGFFLGVRYDPSGVPHWGFGMKQVDSDDGPWNTVYAPTTLSTSDVGRWVKLTAVADVTAGTIKLYVDGALVSSQARTIWWHAGGPLTIGKAVWSPAGGQPSLVDQWVGDIDEVRVYAGAVADGQTP